ncbi:hypothetical protein PAXRUDRAFT_174380 [Paxillus rubicundulus Ve08.2h10]|uniref:Unplaced genomic scaffold scaffold_3662, whole genome shotgun sequence n=1 Tax=Paxillus rubicundulus Ve08.2h10 TaxID=930991 RepID=A0A0D0CUX4_9AGAM|nr:hypothetical protein PAXRUDRAFT_174380 [Paxillus rubicundulus Ve08.2h10]
MLPATWTNKEQSVFLQSQLLEYIEHTGDKNYNHFWPTLYATWFSQWPEKDTQFPDVDGPLTTEQETFLGDAIEVHKNVSCSDGIKSTLTTPLMDCSLNHIQKKQTSVFDNANELKGSHLLTQAELYSLEYYNNRIKPHIKAEQEAGNIKTCSKFLATVQKLSKELLDAEDEDIKQRIQEMYEAQKKQGKRDTGMTNQTDPDAIQEAIKDLLFALAHIAALIKQRTCFVVSFICAGPDPSRNWEITS